jgi:ABC-type Fe3+/spermidine/putrescine transport system ATPase subunit
MADRIAVMRAGRIEQVGTPDEVYEAPRTRFVSDFIGVSNFFEGRLLTRTGDRARFGTTAGIDLEVVVGAGHPGTITGVMVRPEKVAVRREPPAPGRPNAFASTINDVAYQGTFTRVVAKLGASDVLAIVQNAGRGTALDLRPGQPVFLCIDPESFCLFEEASG